MLTNFLLSQTARVYARFRGRRTSWIASMYDVKADKRLSPEEDMKHEICHFFHVTEEGLTELEKTHGCFSSPIFQEYVHGFFANRTSEDTALFDAYRDVAFYYSLMLGLGCPRYGTLFWYLEYLLHQFDSLGRKPVAVDYGSGVGDTAILLAAHGFEVYLVDLVDKKSDFAKWRMDRRKLPYHFIPVTSADPYPQLPTPADLVVTIEVWEHLRSPLTALQNINFATLPGVSYLLNTNKDFDYVPEGDHLEQGIIEGRSLSYRHLYAASWEEVAIEAPDGTLFRRK